jgi:predicted nucleic acid-binding protein
MESTLLGLVLDSSTVIDAERKKQPVTAFIENILTAHGRMDLSLSPVTVAELVHGIYRARTPEASQRRREYIERVGEPCSRPSRHQSHGLAYRADRRRGSSQRKRSTFQRSDDCGLCHGAGICSPYPQSPSLPKDPGPYSCLFLALS